MNISCCFCSVTVFCPAPWDPIDCSTPGFLSFSISGSLLILMSIEYVMSSNYLSSITPFSCSQFFPASGSYHVPDIATSILNIAKVNIHTHTQNELYLIIHLLTKFQKTNYIFRFYLLTIPKWVKYAQNLHNNMTLPFC